MPRAVWKGTLRVGSVACPIALFTAVSSGERIAFHTVNRANRHRVHREFVDVETGEPVPHDEQVKGYDTGSGSPVVLEPAEIAAALPENTKTMAVERFLDCTAVDTLFLDRPYYVTAADTVAGPILALLRDGLKGKKAAAIASALLFRKVRTVLIRVQGDAVVAHLLRFDNEVRSAADAFKTLAAVTVTDEMLELAQHIIKTKSGRFDPKHFDDRYEAAVAALVRAKIDGRPFKRAATTSEPKAPSDLLAALRESAGAAKARRGTAAPKRSAKRAKAQEPAKAAPRRKAG